MNFVAKFKPEKMLLVSMSLAGILLIIVHYANRDKFLDAYIAFASIFISVIAGTSASMMIYNRQKDLANGERLQNLTVNLQAEFEGLCITLNGDQLVVIPPGSNGKKFTFLIGYLQSTITEECVKSDLFFPDDAKDLLRILRAVKFYNIQVSYFLSLQNNSNNQHFTMLLSTCYENMKHNRSTLLENIEKFSPKLKTGLLLPSSQR